ncbi:hypothetical protein ELI_10460 [Erythrobacter litoralis HTCC2594]|uniref:Uncharacterized protein n=1 Tax=Erythrobacter litoralis (strain HTCC2594) TaxID=314225 RepID=Q2N807_ERYLH|nr:hypothetical protein ELI_10460 [Erythrobacter litoralis HTCC2594]
MIDFVIDGRCATGLNENAPPPEGDGA